MVSPEREDFLQYHLEVLARSRLDGPARAALGGLREEVRRLRQDNERLAEHSLTDALTLLGNKRGLDRKKQYLENRMNNERRRKGEKVPYAVVVAFADIVGLKKFNETYTHEVGDGVIKAVASSLQAPFRDNEWFRRGGDEFVGLMEADDAEGIQKILTKLQYTTTTAYAAERDQADTTKLPELFPVRCGVSIFARDGVYPTLDAAEQAADPKSAAADRLISFSA